MCRCVRCSLCHVTCLSIPFPQTYPHASLPAVNAYRSALSPESKRAIIPTLVQIVSEQYVLVPPAASGSTAAAKVGAHRAGASKAGAMPRELVVAENALQSVKVCARLLAPPVFVGG